MRLNQWAVSVLLVLLLASIAYSQTITFVPQAVSRIPGLDEYRVYIYEKTGKPLQVQAVDVIVAAMHESIRPLSYVNLQTFVNASNHRSVAHWTLVGIEVTSWALTALQGSKVVQLKERWANAGPAMLAGGLTLTRTLIERENKEIQVPADLIPPLIAVPANGSVDYAIFAVRK